jgi:biofilm PGA synthesis N-glycosyltransferase PgaC
VPVAFGEDGSQRGDQDARGGASRGAPRAVMNSAAFTYAVITPARNEAEHLPRLAQSLSTQTVLPASWIIVDDGSTDSSPDVVRQLGREHQWMRFVRVGAPHTLRRGSARGAPIVRAFHAGITALASEPELVAKIDADVSMKSDYFERLIAAFAEDPTLGIASGSGFEFEGGKWRQRFVTGVSVWGAARAYRSHCLQQILPLEERMGWDGIDVIKARVRGWKTKTLLDVPFYHHRVEADRETSRWRAWAVQGEASHYMGYRPSYVVLRTLYRMRRDPTAFATLWSFVSSAVRRAPTCPDPSVRACLRSMQRLRHLPTRRREVIGQFP